MKTPDLTLPKSGGTVRFRDDDDLRGKDYRRLRAYVQTDNARVGEATNRATEMCGALLIAEWDVPNLPNLPLPAVRPDGSVDPGGLDLLPWQDLAAVEEELAPFANEALYGRPRKQAAGPLAEGATSSTDAPSSE